MALDDNQAIERAFMASWDHIEKFYVNAYFWGKEWFELNQVSPSELNAEQLDLILNHGKKLTWLRPIQPLMAEMRKRGYDRQLRAGQSMERLIVSRARNHGLRPDQACIIFSIQEVGMHVVLYGQNYETLFELNLPGLN